MPEHVHLLVLPILPQPNIGLFLASLKQPFSKTIKQILIESSSPLLDRLHSSQSRGAWAR